MQAGGREGLVAAFEGGVITHARRSPATRVPNVDTRAAPDADTPAAPAPQHPPRATPHPLRLPDSAAGLCGAGLLFAISLVPSLVPRPAITQGLVSGVAVGIGYGLGCATGRGLHPAQRRLGPDRVRAVSRAAVALTAIAVPAWAWLVNLRWQEDVRALMGMEAPSTYPLAVTVVALLTGLALMLLTRGARATRRAYLRGIRRVVPGGAQRTVHAVIMAVVLAATLAGVAVGRAVGAFKSAMAAADAAFDDDIDPPDSRYRSGGPGSLIAWESLGSTGRRFIVQGPNEADLQAFSGAPATAPIRVYAGLASAHTDAERAALAIAELERTGAFEREVLVVITPTGTGRVNPLAIDPLEYLHNGDTAAVALQYSYYPSWVMLLADPERVRDSARALFDAVSTRLAEEPADTRPRLLLYGESLGSFGSESLFADLDDLRARADGALWVGPPRGNGLWRELTAAREDGSPVWQPVHDGGTAVRFGSDGAALLGPAAPWEVPRVAYLQHSSDPITWWTPRIAVTEPQWLREPRGPDVSDRMPYIPVATFLQVSVDLMLGAKAPAGHGHTFGTAQAEAWSLVAPPESWTDQDTDRLVEVLR